MGKGQVLGEFEEVVLLALARVGDAAYGVPIHDEIRERTGRDVSVASVYVTLGRLEKKGLAHSAAEDRRPAGGGRPRRFYTVTEAGWRALQDSRVTMDQLWEGLTVPSGIE